MTFYAGFEGDGNGRTDSYQHPKVGRELLFEVVEGEIMNVAGINIEMNEWLIEWIFSL